MPRTALPTALLLGAALAGGLGDARAQVSDDAEPPFLDALRMASAPADAADAAALPAGQWRAMLSTGYFNVWNGTWHTGTIHRELGRLGQPLRPDELRLLEQRHPGDEIYLIDLEGTRSEFRLARGLGHGFTVGLRLPWVEIGRPHWDAIAFDVHRAMGLPQGRRDWFPRGQTVLYIHGRRGTLERWAELDGDGLGDASVYLSGDLGRGLGARQRWVATLEAPTGRRGTLWGSGGWDAGVRWFADWGDGRRGARLGAGYTWLDPTGSFLGVRRNDTWHLLAAAHTPLGATITFRTTARLDRSPLARFSGSKVGDPSFYLTVGGLARWGARGWLAFDIGENYPILGVVPDYSFHLSAGASLGAPAR